VRDQWSTESSLQVLRSFSLTHHLKIAIRRIQRWLQQPKTSVYHLNHSHSAPAALRLSCRRAAGWLCCALCFARTRNAPAQHPQTQTHATTTAPASPSSSNLTKPALSPCRICQPLVGSRCNRIECGAEGGQRPSACRLHDRAPQLRFGGIGWGGKKG